VCVCECVCVCVCVYVCVCVDWTELEQNEIQWRNFVSTLMYFRVPYKAGSFFFHRVSNYQPFKKHSRTMPSVS
jgi:hypothetical protein